MELEKVTCQWQHYSFMSSKYVSQTKLIKHYKQQKWTFENRFGSQIFQVFQNTQTAKRFDQVCHPCLLLYFFGFFFRLIMFWAVVFMFHSVWWRFPIFQFRQISWHTSSNFPLEAGSNYLLLFKKENNVFKILSVLGKNVLRITD